MARGAIGLAVLLASVLSIVATADPASAATKTVLELFTSQGCSSCPPADALLQQYVGRDDIIALSLHVDYWDRLGWKDTLGSPVHTDRQRQYARGRGDADVYTPQMVINGRVHANGSSASAIEAGIEETSALSQNEHVAVHLARTHGGLTVETGAASANSAHRNGTLFLALAQKTASVPIARGENAGRKVTYLNVVKIFHKIGAWTGSATSIKIPAEDLSGQDLTLAVVLLQQETGGPILGADSLEIPAPRL